MEPTAGRGHSRHAMKSKPPKVQTRSPRPIRSTGAGERITAEQAALLKRLAQDASEPETFSAQLTRSEAARRIAMLKAKLALQGEPPHTL